MKCIKTGLEYNRSIGQKAPILPTTAWASLERFLLQQRKLSPSTAAKTIRNLKHLEKHGALTPAAFERFIYQFIEKNQIEWYNKLIQAIIHYWKFIGIEATPPPQLTPTEKIKEVFTNEEIQSLLKVAKPSYKECLLLAAHLGCRIGEARHLTAPQFNLVSNCVTIHATKTKGQRIVPIAESIQSEIREFLKGKEGSLFNFSDTALNKELRRCCTKIGIRYRPPKCFRSSFVTRQAGKDLFATMNIVGHKNPKTTLGYWVSNLDILRKTIESDTLSYDSMPLDKKLALFKKQLLQLREALHIDSDFDVKQVESPLGLDLSVHKKKQVKNEENKR